MDTTSNRTGFLSKYNTEEIERIIDGLESFRRPAAILAPICIVFSLIVKFFAYYGISGGLSIIFYNFMALVIIAIVVGILIGIVLLVAAPFAQ